LRIQRQFSGLVIAARAEPVRRLPP
jgi:hypothetical protein